MPADRKLGRWRAAYLALRGEPVVPDSIRAEWANWQLELEGLCDKIGAAAARLNTRHKRDLDRALAELEELKAEAPADPLAGMGDGSGYSMAKRLLNRRVLAARGVHPQFSIPNGDGDHVARDQAKPE